MSKRVKEQAEAQVAALVRSDYKTLVHYSNPNIVKMMGGPDASEQALTKLMGDMKKKGIVIISAKIGAVSKVVKVGTELQCTVRQEENVSSPNGVMYVKSTLVAVSLDGGNNWTFLDTVNKDVAVIKQVWPTLSPELVIVPYEKGMKKAE